MARAPNWFDRGGADYARYRPDYPPELAEALAVLTPARRCAVDVGCGNGQFTTLLAPWFDTVIGTDPSADQIAHALPHPKVEYRCAPAEALPLADGSVDLVTAAQAAHWFAIDAFYAEVARVAAPGAVIALVSYGVCQVGGDDAIDRRVRQFHDQDMGDYWPPERQMVINGYADMPFPFAPLSLPSLAIRRSWTAHQLLGYIGTWSAVRRAGDAGSQNVLTAFAADLLKLWGNPDVSRAIVWPITVRAGRIAPV